MMIIFLTFFKDDKYNVIAKFYWQSSWCFTECICFSRLFLEDGTDIKQCEKFWFLYSDFLCILFISPFFKFYPLSPLYSLSKVALTCMAKLRDERFLCPGGVDSENLTCLDIISVKQLSNGACQSILFKLTMAILRNESSETLRRR